jgi:hypothetical protein
VARIEYVPKVFRGAARDAVVLAGEICRDFQSQGYDLTLRQLYYQFVARDLFPDDRTWRQVGSNKWVRDPAGTKNAEPNYKWLGEIVNAARLSGDLDWNHIVDRLRSAVGGTGSDTDPSQVIEYAASSYFTDKWADQVHHVEAWIEKDALIQVLQRGCRGLEVPYFACRGYVSQSAMWGAAQRLLRQIQRDKHAVIIHLGDHDPSGIDMTRDIEDRLSLFIAQDHLGLEPGLEIEEYREAAADFLTVRRVALEWDQIQRFQPPPNPAKLTDSRGAGYVRRFGTSSWELDALDPPFLASLVRETVLEYRDEELWNAAVAKENEEKKILVALNDHWADVADFVRGSWPDEVSDV